MLKTLESFNFGSLIITWIKLCYQNIERCILNNGWASVYFTLERGVRQGCPLSPNILISFDRKKENKTTTEILVRGED